MKKQLSLVVATSVVLSVAACSPGSPTPTGKNSLQGAAEQLDSASYAALPPLQQYQVANKLTSALFTGVPANEFFVEGSIGADTSKLAVAPKYSNLLGKIRKNLSTPLPEDPPPDPANPSADPWAKDARKPTKIPLAGDTSTRSRSKNEIVNLIEGNTDLVPIKTPKYVFDGIGDGDGRGRSVQYPLAYIYETPLSDDFFARWMAYKLVNTIMFSPAVEIDSSEELDAQTIYENLVSAIKQDASIRSIILAHEKSESNWKRFRSPEDNTREMIEIYLGLFDRDADVPRASQACKNWSLSDEDAGYKLMKGPDENTVPQLILDSYYVTTCDEFFSVISNHPLVIPRVTTVLIDHMFGVEYDSNTRSALARDIAASNPTTFRDLFEAILFSKEFLLNMERPKWFEESYFNVAGRVQWRPYDQFFRQINTNADNGTINASLPKMYQPAFTLKLGRWPTVPSDALATSYQHNGLRSAMLVKSNAKLASDPTFNPTATPSTGWGPELIAGNISTLSVDDFIGYMFISVLGRAPNPEEASTLKQVINSARTAAVPLAVDCTAANSTSNPTNGCQFFFRPDRTEDRAKIVMDYLSRLPETYFYNTVN